MAVKKKSAAKKVAKSTPAKRAVKKTAKKSVAKKSAAKRVAKKVAKRTPVKRAVKKTAKKSAAKKVAKKVATKKSSAKKAVKKTPVKISPSVINVSTTPQAPKPSPVEVKPVVPKPAEPRPLPPKPVAAPKESASGRVIFLVVAGIVLLAAIVWSQSGSKSEEAATPDPAVSQSAQPTEPAVVEPTEPAVAVVTVEAPTRFVALNSSNGLKLRWVAPTAIEGLTGYNVEIRANGSGDWVVIAAVPIDHIAHEVTKTSDSGWTQFRVTSVYSDGQVASATAFGIPGEFK